jgi:predicted ATP-dependent protease
MGKVLGVGGIQAKVQAAIEAGIKQVIVPQENENELAFMADYLKNRLETIYVSNIHEVLDTALFLG